MDIDYREFVQSKVIETMPIGIDVTDGDISPILFKFQRQIVKWAVKKGRCAVFAGCGMGKTFIQLEWARLVPGNALILAPLAVAPQTVREGAKLGIEVVYAKDQTGATGKITITNYESLHKFDPDKFDAIVLDESSILKSYMGKTKRQLISLFERHQYKICCTATPSPNDHMELGNHAEFLGVMPSNEMLSRWFINDTMKAGAYRLKAHGKRDFWRWVSSWAVSLQKPSDIGDYDDGLYVLPALNVSVKTVSAPVPEGKLFHGGTLSATEIHRVKRGSAADRASEVAAFVAKAPEQCLVWCDTNYEADEVCKAIPSAVDVRGSDSDAKKESALTGFADGAFQVLVTKPDIAGFGMNFQQCHRVAFVGLSYSFEALYQSLRRVYRFGQAYPVECLIVESEAEVGIREVVERKIKQYDELQSEMCAEMRDFQNATGRKLSAMITPVMQQGDNWQLWNGDCVEVLSNHIGDNQIDYSIFSPPFANLYIYSHSIADMGNCVDYDEFFTQFGYLIRQLYRVTVNGRLCSVHCKDLPAYKGRDGYAGLVDFPGRIISAFEDHDWKYHSRVTIWKDPVTEMQRTKNHGLLHKQLCKDSAASRQGMADYLITFRKWDGEDFPKPVNGAGKDTRFDKYIGDDGPKNVRDARDMSIQVWQRYASPVWFDVHQQRVLQGSSSASCEDDEKHLCPLQLDVIDRCIHLWTNPGDLVLSPFAGIGSEGYSALKMDRRFIGAELKESYFKQAVKNIQAVEHEKRQHDLFGNWHEAA